MKHQILIIWRLEPSEGCMRCAWHKVNWQVYNEKKTNITKHFTPKEVQEYYIYLTKQYNTIFFLLCSLPVNLSLTKIIINNNSDIYIALLFSNVMTALDSPVLKCPSNVETVQKCPSNVEIFRSWNVLQMWW